MKVFKSHISSQSVICTKEKLENFQWNQKAWATYLIGIEYVLTYFATQQIFTYRPSIAYVGDGAWGMSLNEVLTCVRENIPAIAVVFNNEQWGAEKKNQVDFYKDRFIGTNLTNPSFAEISRTMGAEGIKVTKPEEIGDALTTLIASGKPGVLEIAVSQVLADPFRRDALSAPIRHLDKYKHCV